MSTSPKSNSHSVPEPVFRRMTIVKAKVYGNTDGKKTQVLLAICSEGKLETGKIMPIFN